MIACRNIVSAIIVYLLNKLIEGHQISSVQQETKHQNLHTATYKQRKSESSHKYDNIEII